MAVDSTKIRTLRESARDEALATYQRMLKEFFEGDASEARCINLRKAYMDVDPMLTKIAAYDEILALDTPTMVNIPGFHQPQAVIPNYAPPPRPRSQAELAAESAAEAEAVIERMDAEGKPKDDSILNG